jgi:asparagine synthase (glutamine-hydrolysing)
VAPRAGLLDADFSAVAGRATETLSNAEGNDPLSFTLFKDLPWHEYNRLAVEQSQLTMRSPFVDNDLVRLLYRAAPALRRSKEMSLRLVEEASPALGNIVTDRGIGKKSTGVGGRMARLYREASFKAEYGYHKFHHFRVWFRDQLAEYVRAILLDRRALDRPYLNKHFVDDMVTSHVKGLRNYTTEITQVLTVELTQRLLCEDI